MIMPIATDTLADPNTLPTTVGMVEKKPPFPMPLIIAKAMSGASEFETGHRTSMLTALRKREKNRVLSGPAKSLKRPQQRRPMADEKLNAATRPAVVLEERWRELP